MRTWPDKDGVYATNHSAGIQHFVGDEMIADKVPSEDGYEAGRHGIHVCADELSFDYLVQAYEHGNGPYVKFAKVEVECFNHYASGRFDDAGYYQPISNHETWHRVVIRSITPLLSPIERAHQVVTYQTPAAAGTYYHVPHS